MADPLHLLKDLDHTPRGVIHVGSNDGHEFAAYQAAGLAWAVYIEALPAAYDRLRARLSGAPNHLAINALCADIDGIETDFHIASNEGHSSSMLEFGWHREQHPEVSFVRTERLRTQTLDSVIDALCAARPEIDPGLLDCLVLDVQGSELRVLQGAHRCLRHASYVYTEVNEGGLYRDDCSLDDIITFMRLYRFRLKHLVINRHRWGDALFVREG